MLSRNLPIFRIKQVQEAVEEQTGLEVTHTLVSKVLRKEMRMGYRLDGVKFFGRAIHNV